MSLNLSTQSLKMILKTIMHGSTGFLLFSLLVLKIILTINRHWVVERFNLFSVNELDFADSHINEDIRNNSAWNYRYFICLNLSDRFQQQNFLQSEIESVI